MRRTRQSESVISGVGGKLRESGWKKSWRQSQSLAKVARSGIDAASSYAIVARRARNHMGTSKSRKVHIFQRHAIQRAMAERLARI